MRRRNLILISIVATIALTGLASILRVGATAGASDPVPAAENLAALNGPPLFTLPPRVERLGAGLRPPLPAVRALGQAGYAWVGQGGAVCTIMNNDAGGCFSTFQQPALLFMVGIKNDGTYGRQSVSGVAMNGVRNVVLVTNAGARVNTELSNNGLYAEVPPGSSIVGEFVTFDDGETQFVEDDLRPMP